MLVWLLNISKSLFPRAAYKLLLNKNIAVVGLWGQTLGADSSPVLISVRTDLSL